jgi:hypothetical protein
MNRWLCQQMKIYFHRFSENLLIVEYEKWIMTEWVINGFNCLCFSSIMANLSQNIATVKIELG